MAMTMRMGSRSGAGDESAAATAIDIVDNPVGYRRRRRRTRKHTSSSSSNSNSDEDLNRSASSSSSSPSSFSSSSSPSSFSSSSSSSLNSDPDPDLEHIHGSKNTDLQISETESISINHIRKMLRKQEISTATESANLALEAAQLSNEVCLVACGTVIMLAALYAAISSTDCVKSWGPPVWMAASLSCSGILGMVDRLLRMVEAEGKASEERISGTYLYMDMETLQKDAVNSADLEAIKARLAEKLIRKPVSKPGLAAIPAYGWITVVFVLLISLLFIFSIAVSSYNIDISNYYIEGSAKSFTETKPLNFLYELNGSVWFGLV